MPLTVLTPANAATDLQTNGLDALGLTVPNLSPVWSSQGPGAYRQAQLTLQMTNMRAPFRGVREFLSAPTFWSGTDGLPLPGPVALFRMHPDAPPAPAASCDGFERHHHAGNGASP
jgi:hypothetical protein